MNQFALCSNRVCLSGGVRPAAVIVQDQSIIEIASRDSLDRRIEQRDLGDLMISPGIVDTHVHINEPGTDWEGFKSATRAAAAGGVTTMVDMPLNSLPVTTTPAALQEKREAAQGKCWIDVGFYGGLIPGNADQIQALIEQGVLGIKAFLCDSGLDQFPPAGQALLRGVLPMLKSTRTPLLVHAELVDGKPAPMTDKRSYPQYLASRPDAWEVSAVKLLTNLSREFGAHIHILHLSTERALSHLMSVKAERLAISVETCPHYLYFASEQIADGATQMKCAPPIRQEHNRQLLCDALDSGIIDTIGSDHSPCPPELKKLDQGSFPEAWGGIAGLQLTLPVVWTVGRKRGWKPEQLSKWLSLRPAKLVGLEKRKGQLAAGFDADIVVWDPDAQMQVDQQNLFHRHAISAYHGRRLHGVVQQTYLRGQLVFNAGQHSTQPMGKLISAAAHSSPGFRSVAQYLNRLDETEARNILEKCCAAQAWVDLMISCRPFANDQALERAATNNWNSVDRKSRLEAFAAHPRIGSVDSLRAKFANTEVWSAREQDKLAQASEKTLQRLASQNDFYFNRFGYIFIVCASGKSAQQMLEILESRLSNDPATELNIASVEQLKITLIRLRKLAP